MSLRGFFKATIVGGVLFLLPMVLILIVLRHAMQLAVSLQNPFRNCCPWSPFLASAGVRRPSAIRRPSSSTPLKPFICTSRMRQLRASIG